jgi:hypothetical protein
MIDDSQDAAGMTGKSPLVLEVPPNSPLIGLRDPRTGLMIVIGCRVAVCPQCGSVQLEESWSESGGCSNPDCLLAPVSPIPAVAQEPTLTFPYHKPAIAGSEDTPEPSISSAPPPAVMPEKMEPKASVPPVSDSTPPAQPAPPQKPVIAPIPPRPKPAHLRPMPTGAAKPPPYIAPQPKHPNPQPPTPPPVAETPVPQPKPTVIPPPTQPAAPTETPITSTLPPPIVEIPEGWLAPAPPMESTTVAESPSLSEEPPVPPSFAAAAPPPESSIIPTPMLLEEDQIVDTPSTIAPPIVEKLCIFCGRSITANDKVRVCARCGALHHLDCWEANRGCARPLCGSKVTLAQARPNADDEELPTKPFYSDPWGKPHRRSFGEALRTILGKKEILIGLATIVVVVVVIFILISAFGQPPQQETKGSVTVTMPATGDKTESEAITSPEAPVEKPSANNNATVPRDSNKSTDKKQPAVIEVPKITTPTYAPSEPIFPPLEESDIRQGLAGVQQNASIRYQSMLKKKKDLRGSIIVTFTVNPNGTVSGLMVAKNTMNDSALGGELESQITNGIKRVRFRQSPKGKTTSFTFSFAP